METEVDCQCLKIIGHLEYVDWLLWPRDYRRLKAPLPVEDFTRDKFLWLHYVESSAGLLAKDEVLKSLDSRYWSIHDVQRYFIGDLHCEQVLFPYQYPSLRMPTRLGRHLFNFNVSLKKSPILYTKEFNISLEVTLKKMVHREVQIGRLIISDQLIKLDQLDYFKRKTFFRLLLDIMSFQDRLQLVSFENLCCSRLEGVRLIEHIACFNATTLKYLFLWRFVLPNENPLLINYSYITGMSTDDDKSKIAKLLSDLEVPDVKLSERCHALVREFHNKFAQEVEGEENEMKFEELIGQNPYKVDDGLLEDNERKLKKLLSEDGRAKAGISPASSTVEPDPKRLWRTNSCKERLQRIESDLRMHRDTAMMKIQPLPDAQMRNLVRQCSSEPAPASPASYSVQDVVDAAKKSLPNFQYRRIENSTATVIMPGAHRTSGGSDRSERDFDVSQYSDVVDTVVDAVV